MSLIEMDFASGGGVSGISTPIAPIMTDNTTPSGQCSGSSTASATTYDYFMAFNHDVSKGWLPLNTDSTPYISYSFSEPKILTDIDILLDNISSTYTFRAGVDMYVEGYNGSTWERIGTEKIGATTKGSTHYKVDNNKAYSAYRIYFDGYLYKSGSGSYACRVVALQFYGY